MTTLSRTTKLCETYQSWLEDLTNKMYSRGVLLFLIVSLVKFVPGNLFDLYDDEIESLSELPLDKLIKIKSSLTPQAGTSMESRALESNERIKLTLPVALPLKRNGKVPLRRHGGDHYDEKGKDTKISKIFQLAVTALSFLAFGGYLLTLIITSIRRNSATTGTGNIIVFSNLQSLQKYKRPKRYLILDPMENDFDTDRLYQGMIMLSRVFARYD